MIHRILAISALLAAVFAVGYIVVSHLGHQPPVPLAPEFRGIVHTKGTP